MKTALSNISFVGPLTGFAIGLVIGVLMTLPPEVHATVRISEVVSPSCELTLSTGPMAAWRRKIETTRTLLADVSRLTPEPIACQFDESEGVLRSDYRFSNGNTLRASLDTKINHLSIVGRMTSLPPSDRSVLVDAEQTLFGAGGCGIDWASLDGASEGTTELRGDKCGCRASVDRTPAGAISFFSLRAACER